LAETNVKKPQELQRNENPVWWIAHELTDLARRGAGVSGELKHNGSPVAYVSLLVWSRTSGDGELVEKPCNATTV
jgi:hypothetical protein